MPNTGRPSRDCDSCRKRRIKCDLKYPECSQCLRKKWKCPGYRKESDVLFRTETVLSFPDNQSRDRRRTQTRQAEREDFFKKQDEVRSLSKQPSHYPRRTMISKSLTETWNNHFIPLALTGMRSSTDMPLTIINTISHLISQEKRESALYGAFNALACVFLGQTDRSKNALALRIKSYRNALTAINSTLRDPQKCKSNSTLLAIWVLGVYEFIADPTNMGWHIHSEGLINLFRLRGSENYATEDGRNLFLLVFNNLQIQAIRTGQESYITESITLVHDLADHCHSSEYLPLRTCIFTYHCALLCSRIRRLLNEANDAELLSNAASILQDLDTVETKTDPLSDKRFITSNIVEPPLPAAYSSKGSNTVPSHPTMIDSIYRGSIMYRINWRIRVSLHVLEFLQQATVAANCTSSQRITYTLYRLRCIDELRALVERAAFYLGTEHDKQGSVHELACHIRTNLLPRTGPSDGIQDFVVEEP
ncbi:conserved hypothetical protein [Talaromyces stipitatus ATCC 10500]|uniref:Zn(2)-C6 fungal-type domain-containing protein n=1 Tax=Talaromyces stipitatus (strain ATCC 10500 / CBS 375.48 / QM 6759 / NRRL 1006) TaxID=441959 RepID=B8M1E1_TALSN|nr:uncharacterized protein TSTA_090770 [Talaromyces stipitatus ATCC 10500]EED21837.1 conserved hypothetical protein [Talaromyces stipitatus ATCC 10500]